MLCSHHISIHTPHTQTENLLYILTCTYSINAGYQKRSAHARSPLYKAADSMLELCLYWNVVHVYANNVLVPQLGRSCLHNACVAGKLNVVKYVYERGGQTLLALNDNVSVDMRVIYMNRACEIKHFVMLWSMYIHDIFLCALCNLLYVAFFFFARCHCFGACIYGAHGTHFLM